MIQVNETLFHAEHRRPGLWIVACRSGAEGAPTLLFTIDIALDRATFEHHYRVSGKRNADFRHIHTALDFCKSVAGIETAR